MKVALVQMDVLHCCRELNIEQATDHARDTGADMIIFPEVFTTGFCYERIAELAESEPYPTIECLKQISAQAGNIIIGSIIVAGPDARFSNLGFVLDDGRLAGTYSKVHLFGTEKDYFTPGSSIEPVETSAGRIGLMICYDLRFPEVGRKLALAGADILVTIARFPAKRQSHWDTLVRARAIENQMVHAACNCVGSDPYDEFTGGSVIIDGLGRELAAAGSIKGVVTAEVDIAEKEHIRRDIPCFADRREALY